MEHLLSHALVFGNCSHQIIVLRVNILISDLQEGCLSWTDLMPTYPKYSLWKRITNETEGTAKHLFQWQISQNESYHSLQETYTKLNQVQNPKILSAVLSEL